ncbi:uncharacterized protein ARMOST_10214 [Armillaria ostoyae]|uniref:Integrase catalytic domain-containing protein n=1 Tax=Armillaria ostoyae TaxID=47428 RepID=A0A284RDN3_ARMOS|nr:uncharacterized protein ARMOST_10214 [Armillaria ostoyae]
MDLPWSGEFNAIYVVVDRLMKHAQFIPTTTGLDAEEFRNLFTRNVICRYGLPTSIIADRDPRWMSDFWKGVSKALKTRMALSSSHHPQHDGQTEVTNKFLKTMLRAYIAGDLANWGEWLQVLEFAYNSHQSASMKSSPFSLLLGFQPTSPLELIAKGQFARNKTNQLTKEATEFLADIEVHCENARLSIARAHENQTKYYNANRKPFPELEPGHKVLINPHSLAWKESKGKGAKLVQRWIGPFEVLEKINLKAYRLRMGDKYPGSPVFNIEHLKPYQESPKEFQKRTLLPETREGDSKEEFEVEKIVGHRYQARKLQFLVRWLGYGPQFDSWATAKDLTNAPEVL